MFNNTKLNTKLTKYLLVIMHNSDSDRCYTFYSLKSKDRNFVFAEAAIKAGVDLHKSEVRLPDGVLRSVGDFDIEVQLHPDVKTTIVVSIVPEK